MRAAQKAAAAATACVNPRNIEHRSNTGLRNSNARRHAAAVVADVAAKNFLRLNALGETGCTAKIERRKKYESEGGKVEAMEFSHLARSRCVGDGFHDDFLRRILQAREQHGAGSKSDVCDSGGGWSGITSCGWRERSNWNDTIVGREVRCTPNDW